MMQDIWNTTNTTCSIRPSKSAPCSPIKPIGKSRIIDSFHVAHKVPIGDTPYVKAKRVQLVDKDPEKAIALFWAAINAGDRVDSALKDMAIVMKQQNRAEEAIEAIKSLRNRCSEQAQEALDNILLDLYKRCGRLDDQIALLKHKLQLIQQGLAFNGKRTKTARSQGRKFQVSIEQEATRLLGNLGWALMQKDNYVEAESAYRKALLIGPDNNKMCNLGICLMKQGRIAEAKETLRQVRPAVVDNIRGADSHLKAYERAQEMLRDIEARLSRKPGQENWLFDALVGGSSSIWKPEPCIDYSMLPPRDNFSDENVANGLNLMSTKFKAELLLPNNMLNIDAAPFYSSRLIQEQSGIISHQLHDPLARAMKEQNGIFSQHQQLQDALAKLKRTRSGNAVMEKSILPKIDVQKSEEGLMNCLRKSLSGEDASDKWPELPDNNAFNEAIVAAILAPVLEVEDNLINNNTNTTTTDDVNKSPALCEAKGKRLRIFQDITQAMDSPKQKLVYNI